MSVRIECDEVLIAENEANKQQDVSQCEDEVWFAFTDVLIHSVSTRCCHEG